MLKVLVLVLVVFVTLTASKSRKMRTETPPGHCHHKGHSIKEGETLPAPIGKCKAFKCLNAETNTVKTMTCALRDRGENCVKMTKGIKRNEAYPACCPKVDCTPK